MPSLESLLPSLDPPTRLRLEDMRSSLRVALQDNLRCLLVFGSAARGGFVASQSDVDTIIVLSDAPREALLRCQNALQLARHSARIEAMILVEREIARAADVFPLLYDDIRGSHVVIHGTSPFADLAISDAHRRLRIEQELREASIRLRRAYVDNALDPRAVGRAVQRKLKQLRGPLHALLALRGIPARDTVNDVLESAGRVFECDTSALTNAGAAHDPLLAHDALVELLSRSIAWVDGMEG